MNKPCKIWNADETGFSVGSIASKVVGPTTKAQSQIPHLAGGHSKQRFSVMFCGCADGTIIPPFFIYPQPKPRGYDPLTGAMEGSDIAYTKKGWMDNPAFKQFLCHFDKNVGEERPIVLLIDSVSSHVDMASFEYAQERGIEIYRLLPNATHLMQPLDVGVFGPLKTRWHQVLRKHTREFPGFPVQKHNFAEKLKEAFLLFYKPLTVINSFKTAGIYPLDSNAIALSKFEPGITFSGSSPPNEKQDTADERIDVAAVDESTKAAIALEAIECELSTPIKQIYAKRLEEGHDIEGVSPRFDLYKKLYFKSSRNAGTQARQTNACSSTGLDLLAEAAAAALSHDNESQQSDETLGLESLLVFPQGKSSVKKRTNVLDSLPDNLTSTECLHAMSLKHLEKVKKFALQEKKAKEKFLMESLHARGKTVSCKRQRKKSDKKDSRNKKPIKSGSKELGTSKSKTCIGCHMTWEEDQALGRGSVWVQCDVCENWIHDDCCPFDTPKDQGKFICPECLA